MKDHGIWRRAYLPLPPILLASQRSVFHHFLTWALGNPRIFVLNIHGLEDLLASFRAFLELIPETHVLREGVVACGNNALPTRLNNQVDRQILLFLQL